MQAKIATIGFFDGVHLGHLFLFSQLREEAEKNHFMPVIYTFQQHPKSVLTGCCPPLLTTSSERIEKLSREAKVEVLDFSQVHHLTAAQFMAYLKEQGVEQVLMGYDHRFGSDGLAEWSMYEQIAGGLGMHVLRAKAYCAATDRVSSSSVRKAIENGEIEHANKMLGYRFSLTGQVEHGHALGRTIGFPTANITIDKQRILPRLGVYSGRACIANRWYKALINIGTNPTIDNTVVSIEVYLVGFSGDLYGQKLSVELEHYLRPEKRFDSLEQLTGQITNDLKHLG